MYTLAPVREGDVATLVYSTLGTSAQDGPLVQGIGLVEFEYLAATNPASLAQYMNQALLRAEEGLEEGARVQLDVTGWSIFGLSGAQYVASQIQSAWQNGQIVDPNTGETPQPWPEFAGQIAWGDDSTDTVTLRVLKGQPPIWVLYIVIGLLALVAVALLYRVLTGASWTGQVARPPSAGQSGTIPTTGPQFLAWAIQHWYVWVIGAGVLAAAPFVVRQVRATEEAAET